MPAPYSLDLRKRVVFAHTNGEGSMKTIAQRFGVSKNFVYTACSRYKQEGTLEPRPHQSGNSSPIQEIHKPFFEAELKENPDLTLVELCQKFGERFGVTPSESAMSRAFKRLKISRKKNSL